MVEHIEETFLSCNLRYRFEYLSKFLHFTKDDIITLNNLELVLHPALTTLVDKLYDKLLQFDITKRYFLMRNSGFDGKMETDESEITANCQQLRFRKEKFIKYLSRVLKETDWNDSFLQFLSTVGKVHTNFAGAHSVDIDYIHMNLLLAYLHHTLFDHILNNQDIQQSQRSNFLFSLNKFLWIQNDFFTMHYFFTTRADHHNQLIQVKHHKKVDFLFISLIHILFCSFLGLYQ